MAMLASDSIILISPPELVSPPSLDVSSAELGIIWHSFKKYSVYHVLCRGIKFFHALVLSLHQGSHETFQGMIVVFMT